LEDLENILKEKTMKSNRMIEEERSEKNFIRQDSINTFFLDTTDSLPLVGKQEKTSQVI
jgi:hypothetical protein